MTFSRLFLRAFFFSIVKSRTDKAVDEQVKKFLLDSCKVDADKVRSFILPQDKSKISTVGFDLFRCLRKAEGSDVLRLKFEIWRVYMIKHLVSCNVCNRSWSRGCSTTDRD